MRNWVWAILLFCSSSLQAQLGSFRPTPTHLKLLELSEKEDLPFFYHDDIESSVQDFARNYQGSSSQLLGRWIHFDSAFASLCEEMNLPRWLLLIPLANTGYEPKFRDSTGASGLWPLPYNIGKKYGLKELPLYDERYDPSLSSRAALQYLSALYTIYQDWRLAIVAFRQGPIYVNQLLHSMNSLRDFESIFERLDPDARQTIVQFYACAAAFYRSDTGLNTFQMMGKPLSATPYYSLPGKVVASLDKPIDYSDLKQFFGLEWSDFQGLNLALKSTVVPYPGKPFALYLPPALADSFESQRDSFARWLAGPPPATDTASMEDSAQVQPAPIGPEYVWVYYKIKSGDNVYTLADVFDCSSNQLRAWNRISGNAITAGKTLKFHVPASRKAHYSSINSMTHAQKKSLADRD